MKFSKLSHRALAFNVVRLVMVILALSCVKVSDVEARQPNILFILADDLGYMDIGANNPKTFYETPNIDSIAAKGMRFTAGYAACPVCSPTRASIMTGKYPVRTRVTNYIPGDRSGKFLPATIADHLALEECTVAESLRDGGYTTFFAGKWHLGNREYSPKAQGFSSQLEGEKQFFYPPSETPPPAQTEDPKSTDRIADAAVRFIATNKDRPFFAYLPFPAVHIPIGAKASLIEKYQKKMASAPADVWGEEEGKKVRLVQNHAAYAAMLEQFDTAVGRVLAALDQYGVAKETIVVFMSDNGGLSTAEGHPTSNLPLRGGKGWLYEGGIREPLFIRWPGVTKAGSICDTPVTSTDFYPTFLEAAGLPLIPRQHRDGVSIMPLLKGQNDLERKAIYWHYPHYSNQGGFPGGAIREGDWKLIERYEDGRVQLYNLKNDIEEQKDLAKKHPGRVDAMREKLHAWYRDTGAEFLRQKEDGPEPWHPVLNREPYVYKKVGTLDLKLSVIKPSGWQAQNKLPAIVLFHGGGWVAGTPSQLDSQADYFASRGMVSVLVQYRLLEKGAKKPPIMCVQDAKSAMRWVRANANKLGIDPNRIAAGGGSAGGHLSAFVGMVNGLDDSNDDLAVSPKANALVLFNPVFNNGPGEYGYDRVGELYRKYSPAHNITSNAPPAIVFLGTKDRLIPVKTVKDFQTGMKAVGVRCDAFFYEGQGHGFFKKEPYQDQTLAEADKFLTSLGWLQSKPIAKESKGKESAGATQNNQSK